MDHVPAFNAQQLEAACKVLGDTACGLTGSQIEWLLREIDVKDVSPEMTKWKRLFNALVGAQNRHQVGNHLIMLINRAMNPVNYVRDAEMFTWRRDELNVVLAFSGYQVREDGRVSLSIRASKEVGRVEDADRILAFLKERPGGAMPYSDQTSAEDIQRRFQLSKSAFKRALGKLMKEGLITQQGNWTNLAKTEGEQESEHSSENKDH